MSGISNATLWWDEWQMRILVAGSLLIQWFLLLAAPMRKYTIPSWVRRLIWLGYISSDALAIYALATLFNRQTKTSSPCHTGFRASSLEVLWAPVLLIHLGGREGITAYNIEDNDAWTRHTVTLVSQATVALYGFHKAWPGDGDRRLLWSAVLLFIIGILSFCEKPWALRRASVKRLASVDPSVAADERHKERSKLSAAWYLFTELNKKPDRTILSENDKLQMILFDRSLVSAAVSIRQKNPSLSMEDVMEDVLGTLDPDMMKNTSHWLGRAFGLLYTRANVVSTPAYLACHVLLVPSLHATAIALFATSDKQAYEKQAYDVKMTYVILCFTAVLDVFEVPISGLLYQVLSTTKFPALCETLPSDNLIDAVQKVKNPRTKLLIKFARSLRYNGHFFHRDNPSNLYGKVVGFVVSDLLGCKVLGLDFASYRDTNRMKNWALKKLEVLFDKGYKTADPNNVIWRSLRELPFDESILRWHIATDLCFRLIPPPPNGLDPFAYTYRKCAAGISNYMAHLLNCRPDMLMTGSRQHLFSEALRSMDSMGRVVWRSIEDAEDACSKTDLIRLAWELAKELLDVGDDMTRWELMYRVWVGLLCYSASMSRGYQHAKSLGEGGGPDIG
nr:unnamed protein product [Digitaria exilis]